METVSLSLPFVTVTIVFYLCCAETNELLALYGPK